MATYDITAFGAVPDGETLSTAAIQKAVDAAAAARGGIVRVPAGQRFVTGTVMLKDGVNLHLEPGSTLLGSARREDYRPNVVPGEYAGGASGFLIEAQGAEGAAVTGQGTIDARGRLFMEGFKPEAGGPYIYKPAPWRPRMCGLYGCRRLTIRDVTLRDAANWCLHLTGCDDVVISGIRILNDLAVPNCDGIDPDHCTNVRISDCHIEAGDDCIVIKATRGGRELGYGGSHNVTVTNCTCISTSAALKIGTESHGDFSNILFSNCVVRSSSRGLAIQLRDTGNIENVLFSNCTVETRLFHENWWGRAEPIYVTALPRNAQTRVGRVRNVKFANILCRGENGVFVAGREESPIENLSFDNVDVEVDKWTRWPGGQHDRRPSGGLEHGGLTPGPTCGFFIEHARGVRLSRVAVRWGAHRQPYWGPALETRHVTDLRGGVEEVGDRGQVAEPGKRSNP